MEKGKSRINMISIITPVLNEKSLIKPFFEHLNQLVGDFELVLVDGESRDGTLKEIKKQQNIFKHRLKFIETRQGRGHQMNKGASIAKGDIFLFLHIDCTLEKDTIPFIEKEIKRQELNGGALIQAFTNTDDYLTLLSNLGNLRAKINKIFYGDYGIFIRKDIFEKIGGYADIPYLEDVEFSIKAKKNGKMRQINRTIYTSPRRFMSIGKLKITFIFTIAVLLNMIGIRPKRFYKYIVTK
jgi:rSAM/selenodomain-associated transferase 2